MLRDLGENPVRVFVVWEPVVATDLAPPTTAVLARAADPRVAQYWDPSRARSRALVKTAEREWGKITAAEDLRDAGIVWDYLLIFPSGGRWSETGPPIPEFAGGTVVDTVPDARSHLSALAKP